MRNAYALLGLSFLVVFIGAYLLIENAHAPGQLADNNSNNMSFSLTSSAFTNGELIPAIYTCDGENINPPLSIHNVPIGTKSFVLVMDDSDIPEEIKKARGIEKFDHWVVYNLPAEITEIEAGGGKAAARLNLGQNTAGNSAYTGPCPPADLEPTEHHYSFRLYALPNTLNFLKTPTLDEVEQAATASALAKAELIGRYKRQ